jgi:transcriptional regulator with XRE-family HTH domain
MPSGTYLHSILNRFRQLREQAGISQSELEEKLILGPGWVNRFEQGETVPSLDMLLVLLHAIGKDFASLISGIEPQYLAWLRQS